MVQITPPATYSFAADAALGDTLTVIQRPLLNIPSIVTVGDTLRMECEASPATTGWTAELVRGPLHVGLEVISAAYDPATLWWEVDALIPAVPLYELYDLTVTAGGGIEDTTWNAVRVIPEFKDEYYFIHITDTHLPTDLYYYERGADTDTSEMEDLREVIRDINIINPEFVLITGDLIHEGELEEYLEKHYYSRSQRLLSEFEVPVYLTAGNHDIGGWKSTPPPDGTARRNWWRFFGWKRCDNPPLGAPWHTQDYSFDYGPVHYIGLEAYDNYDGWRRETYGGESFTGDQMQWLADEVAGSAGSSARVLFYHYDFSGQINLGDLGLDMGLAGHIHRDVHDFTHPYRITTNNVCNGERSYRLVRVSNGLLQPTGTVSAGTHGRSLTVDFVPANDGTNLTVTAQITNILTERFEHAQLRFLMPDEPGRFQVTGGNLTQVDDSGDCRVCYVAVDILPQSSQTVEITLDTEYEEAPSIPVITDASPNPFSRNALIRFGLPKDGVIEITAYDAAGRLVSRIARGEYSSGYHEIPWTNDEDLKSGVYFIRLRLGSETATRKVVIVR
jgi:hypothetical protein